MVLNQDKLLYFLKEFLPLYNIIGLFVFKNKLKFLMSNLNFIF